MDDLTAGGAAAPKIKKSKPFDPVAYVKRYWLYILIIGSFSFTMLVPFALLVSKPFYISGARMAIIPVVPSLIRGSEEASIQGYFQDYVKTQVARLRGFEIMKQTVQSLPRETRNSFFPEWFSDDQCATLLERMLQVKHRNRTHLIDLSLQGGKPEGLAPIINAVMTSFIQTVQKEEETKDTRRLEFLHTEKNRIQKQIDEQSLQVQRLAGELNTSDFSETYNIHQQRLAFLQKTYVSALNREVETKNMLIQRQKEARQLGALSLDPLIEERVQGDQSLDFTSSWTYQTLQQLRARMDGITKSNPDRKYVEDRMRNMVQYEDKLTAKVRKVSKDIEEGKRTYELQGKIIRAGTEYDSARTIREDLEKRFHTAKKEAAHASSQLLVGARLKAELTTLQERLKTISNRIEEIQVESKAPLRVSIESSARPPDKPAGSNSKKLFMACFALSFGSIGGLLLVLEFMDNRVRSPKNIVHAVGYPSTWPISRSPEGIAFTEVSDKAPSCVTTKALRSLSITLNRESEEQGAKIFLFTGVDHENGTTEILLNTAHQLGHLKPRVLIIEGAVSHPSLRKILRAPINHPTLESMISKGLPFSKCVLKSPEHHVDALLSSGEHWPRQISLAFPMILKRLRSHYDVICIDSDPILRSDQTEYMAVEADVTILIVQGDRTMYRDLRQTLDLLLRLETPALVPVLNWGGPAITTRLEEILDQLREHPLKIQLPGFLKRKKKPAEDADSEA